MATYIINKGSASSERIVEAGHFGHEDGYFVFYKQSGAQQVFAIRDRPVETIELDTAAKGT